MKYRQLGRSGVRVSQLCLGSMNFGGKTDEKTSIEIVHQALDAGINFIDAADVYASGESEVILGKAIAESSCRDRIVLASKAVANMGDGPNDWGASRYHLTRACENSLRRLQTDRIDLFYLHLVDLTTPMEEILHTLETLVRQGKILYIGTSKWPVTLIMEALALSERCGLPRIVAEQPPYHLLDRSIENELVWTCLRHGIGIVPFSPMAGGILSGKYRKGQNPPNGSRYEKPAPDNKRFAPETVDVVEKLISLAETKGVSLAELIYAWLLQRPGIIAPIVGPRTAEHLKVALRACEVTLSDEEMGQIDEIVPSGSSLIDHYDLLVNSHIRKAVNDNNPMAY